MTKTVEICRKNDNLAKATEIMWKKDCGIVPVIDEESKIIGMITDRDICIALASKNQTAAEISVAELVGGKVFRCSEEDKVEDVLKIMKRRRVKRLPVSDKNGELQGIISLSDILLKAGSNKKVKKKILKTLEAISKPRPIVLRAIQN